MKKLMLVFIFLLLLSGCVNGRVQMPEQKAEDETIIIMEWNF